MSVGVALVIGDASTLSVDQEESLAGAGISVAHVDEVPIVTPEVPSSNYDVLLADMPQQYSEAEDTVDRLQMLAIEVPLILLADEHHLSDAYAIAGDTAFDCLPRNVTGAWLAHKVQQAVQRRRWMRGAGGIIIPEASTMGAGVREGLLAGVTNGATLAGKSHAIEQVCGAIAEAARANMSIVIHGETGTGKDVVARLIHESVRPRRSGAFIKVSCPAFPDGLLEEELFGHLEDSPNTGPRRPGRLELAAGGTLLLDEISEMSPAAQARLLDVLEPGFPPASARREANGWDVRLIATTSLAPEQLYTTGEFRRDLYFRLNEYTITLPPLRERPEDIPILAQYFLEKYAILAGGRPAAVSPRALSRLSEYGWPGNVRELEVAIKRYVVSGDETGLFSTFVGSEQPLAGGEDGDRYHESERRVILSALLEMRWNRRKAAKLLGISYNTLRRRIQRYGLNAPGIE